MFGFIPRRLGLVRPVVVARHSKAPVARFIPAPSGALMQP